MNNVLRIWDDFPAFRTLFNDVETPSPWFNDENQFTPACDIEEADSHYLITLDIPGLSRDDLKIEVRGDQLFVTGQRNYERKHAKSHFVERSHGKFERSFRLPEGLKSEGIEASYKDGVLEIAVPKAEVEKPKLIPIKEERSGLFERLVGKSKEGKSTH